MRKAKPKRRRPSTAFAAPASAAATIAGGLVRLASLALLIWVGGFVWFVVTRPGLAPPTTETDGVVVLTGGSGRLARGASVIAANRAQRMLVSGVGEHTSRAALAASVGAAPRLFAAKVDLGYAAVDTRSNAIETAAWVARHRYRSIRLVTSGSHMRRARLELAAQLPSAVRVVEDGVPSDAAADSLAREFTKFALRCFALTMGAA